MAFWILIVKVEDYKVIGNAPIIVKVSNPEAIEFIVNKQVIEEVLNPDNGMQEFGPPDSIEVGAAAPKDARLHLGNLTITIPPMGMLFLGVTDKIQFAFAPTILLELVIEVAFNISGV